MSKKRKPSELSDFTGTVHLAVRGVIKGNRITYKFHVNTSNVRAIGRTSGTEYVVIDNYEYQNIDNYRPQTVYTQVHSIRYIASGGDENFSVENSWHLTVYANGKETVYFNAFYVITC